MKEGYYKIIEKNILLATGQTVVKQYIKYYNLNKEFQFEEFFYGFIRYEFNQELVD